MTLGGAVGFMTSELRLKAYTDAVNDPSLTVAPFNHNAAPVVTLKVQ